MFRQKRLKIQEQMWWPLPSLLLSGLLICSPTCYGHVSGASTLFDESADDVGLELPPWSVILPYLISIHLISTRVVRTGYIKKLAKSKEKVKSRKVSTKTKSLSRMGWEGVRRYVDLFEKYKNFNLWWSLKLYYCDNDNNVTIYNFIIWGGTVTRTIPTLSSGNYFLAHWFLFFFLQVHSFLSFYLSLFFYVSLSRAICALIDDPDPECHYGLRASKFLRFNFI